MTPNQPSKQPIPPDQEKEDFTKQVERLKEHLGFQNKSTWIYLLLILGLFLLFFIPLLGGLMIGGIVGYTFSDEILSYVVKVKETIEADEVSRGVVLGVLCLALLITSPYIILGAAAAVAIQKLLTLTSKKEP